MSILLHLMAQHMQPPAAPPWSGNSFTLTRGNDGDEPQPQEVGFKRNDFGSISDTSQFLDMYGENTHQVDEFIYHRFSEISRFSISGTATVSNSVWTSITYASSGGTTTTLYRADATFTQGLATSGTWTWTEANGAAMMSNGTVTLA